MIFTHFNEKGRAHMVEVTEKAETLRVAFAKGEIQMNPATIEAIKASSISKGDVLQVAQIAGVMGAKKTSDLIPMCHPLMLTHVSLDFEILEDRILIEATVKTFGKTGVEMEALTAVNIAALTIYDMCKAVDKDMVIDHVRLVEKTGGKSGHYKRAGEAL
ncbi:cyclic pyranopterin monophosphate synthase MoaC [Fusibacter sp. 3D3]|uniref:cyclic pyranopterin monophosphate synthase MoaC n=1 Tax=Fusibacter sp. 3D3 TaxID=1048380 RepID=UPI000853C184|nr:cyclic pyranopterin monophosphate synthase MoaC [Fusibacter sp. 3D3]GAU76774.1 molybdenum cofactor biosynthesis protein MoaC [Fusibacter sp. 3D3]